MNNNLSKNDSSELSILDLRLLVHLGNSKEEQLNPQQVSMNIIFSFDIPPMATNSDDISDTICYSIITKLVQNIVEEKSFNLIEHLAASIYTILHKYLKDNKYENVGLRIVIHKISVPVQGLYGGASFSYSGPDILIDYVNSEKS